MQDTSFLPSGRVPLTALHGADAGHRGGRVGDEDLRSVDDPVAVLEHRRRLAGAGVRPRVGLGQPEGGQYLAGAEPRKPLVFLLLVAEVVDRPDAERICRRHRRRLGAVHPGNLLHRDDVGDIADLRPPVLFRDEHAEKPELAHLSGNIDGKFGLFVELFGLGLDDLLGEIAHGLAQDILLFG